MALDPKDLTGMVQSALDASPVDLDALKEQMKNSAELGEKMAQIALSAAERSNELSNKWTRETLANVGNVTKVQDDPAKLAQTFTDFASAQGDLASNNLTAFAEIAKAVQEQTIELMLAAGKEAAAQTSENVKKASAKAKAK